MNIKLLPILGKIYLLSIVLIVPETGIYYLLGTNLLNIILIMPILGRFLLTSWREPHIKGFKCSGGSAMRILLAEDILSIAAVTAAMAEAAGHVVVHAADGIEAVALAAAHDFDLVLMDIEMPGIDGIEATRRIRSQPGRGMTMPIIALSSLFAANPDPELVSRCEGAGFTDWLAKPMTPAHLDFLEVLARQKVLLQPEATAPSRTNSTGKTVAPIRSRHSAALVLGASGCGEIPVSAAFREALRLPAVARTGRMGL
jgi:CheY-like chemotaxis protein